MPDHIQLKTFINHGIPEVDVNEVHLKANSLVLIDVRRPEEFNNELGHIANSKLITLGPELDQFLQEQHKNLDSFIIFICRSGNRSGTATMMARELGFKNTFNMTGGMIRWNDFGLPVSRD